jgi:endonuclease/exonuclease/phosphatase family metal-dependent hydrolase
MSLSLATFNVKNLLDPRDEAGRSLLPRKLDEIARMVRTCDADVVGLQEVGPVELLHEVTTRLPDCGYGEPIVGTPDSRGIRCALLARVRVVAAVVRTAEALSFPVFCAGDPEPFGTRIPLRRGIVHARVDAPGLGEVDVFVAHFKSPLPLALRDASGAEVEPSGPRERAEGVLRSLVWRAAESLYVRGLVDEVLAREPAAHVAVVGDLNDVPGSPMLRALRSEGAGELFDCAAVVAPDARFSILHRGRPTQIDHALATAGLHARLVGAHFLNAELRDHGVFDPERAELMTVDSDHAPLVVSFE